MSLMGFLSNQDQKTYCESCRETLLTPAEVWKIKLEFPGTGGLGLLSKGQQFVLCKKCFLKNAELLELSIIKKGVGKK